MGRERAFTAKVVMLRGKPTGQVGPSELLDPAIGNCFAAEFGCEVTTRMNRERKVYGASCCWFSGDWAHVSNFVAIYITHAHADHFLGLEVLKEAYPGVRIIATSAVVDRINIVYQEKIDKWKKILGTGATSHAVAIERLDGNFIEFESSKIEVLKNIQGDTDENTMLWIPGQGILIAGDVLFNDMHVYTAETDSKARGKWLNSLQRIRELKPSVVVPGHSKVGAPLDASTALDFTEDYLLVFEEELKKAKDADSLINTMKEKFPSSDLLLAIERGAKANVKP